MCCIAGCAATLDEPEKRVGMELALNAPGSQFCIVSIAPVREGGR